MPAEIDSGTAGLFRLGDRVRTRRTDPVHHTRLPRYARGQVGMVEWVYSSYPLPDDRARELPHPRVEHVYSVRFLAGDLWGEGTHTVVLDLWESYLEPEGS
jgi:Nitrile hydratase beta subunit, C-terminal